MKASDPDIPAPITATGGEFGAIGYEYQINVTVWLALELMVRRGWCHSIEVEPASSEDIAAKLEVPPDNATAALAISEGSIDLEIQIKGRSTGQWTTATFRDVITRTETILANRVKGAKKKQAKPLKKKSHSPRPSPLESLTKEQNKQYLFVTNADVAATLRRFVISDVGARSKAAKVPWETTPAVSAQVAERIAIRPQANTEFLNLSIGQLLGSVGVPTQSRDTCRKELVEEIRARLLGKTVKKLSCETLRNVILNHGGTPAVEIKVVRPMNFDLMQERLEQDRVLLLTGPPGTGKTLVSGELARLFQKGDESHEIIQGLQSPAEIRQIWEREGRQLFIVEDPWGAYRQGDQADLWRKELPSLFADLPRRPGKRIIVTSRAGLLTNVGGGDLMYELQKAQISLRSEDYSRIQRREILRNALKGSHTWQRAWLSLREERILDELPEPMALNQFGNRLANANSEEELDVEKLVRACAQDALGSQFAEEVKGRGSDAVDAAIVLWAWHGVQGGLQEETISALLDILKNGGLNVPPDVRKLLLWAEGSEWWPRDGRGWRVHPTLLEGIDNLAGSEPGITSRLLGALISGLNSNGRADQALRLRQKVHSRLTDLDGDIELVLAHHALYQFANGEEKDVIRWYYDAQRYLDVAHPVAKLLKFLNPQGRFPMIRSWKPPFLDPETIAELSASLEARAAALRFIKFVVSRDILCPYNGVELIEFLRKFGWDFAPDCLTLALEELRGETRESCTALVEAGLTSDNPAYEEVFDAALDALVEFEAEGNSQSPSSQAADQFEINPANVEYWQENRGEEYFRLKAPLVAAMNLCRQRGGWLRLAEYSRAQEFVAYWVEILEESDTAIEEIEEIGKICGAENREIFWCAAANCGRTEMVEIILDDFKVVPAETAKKCLAALLRLIASTEYSSVLFPVMKGFPWPRRAQLVITGSYCNYDEHKYQWWHDCFTDAEREAIRCCIATKHNEGLPSVVSSGAVECLEDLANSQGNEQSALALKTLSVLGHSNQIGASQLWQSQRGTDRQDALLAAISTRLPCVKEWLQVGLNDPEARVREIAVRHLALEADESLQEQLLNLKDDPSALVRKALAEAIGEQKWQGGKSALLQLLGDRLDFTEYNDPGARNRFEVARAAAISLSKLKPLDESTIDRVLEFFSERPRDRSFQHDYKIHALLLDSLADESDARIVPFLVAMLGDQWNVAPWRRSYFPLRAAAAWALCRHLENRPEECELVPPSEIAAAANDFNSSLAGPALIVLGLLGERAAGELTAVRNAPSSTVERSLLAWVFMPQAATRERETLRAAISITHPVDGLLDLLESEGPKTLETWRQFLLKDRPCAEWLRSLADGDDVEPLLLAAIRGDLTEDEMVEVLSAALV